MPRAALFRLVLRLQRRDEIGRCRGEDGDEGAGALERDDYGPINPVIDVPRPIAFATV